MTSDTSSSSVPSPETESAARASWVPLLVVVLAQIQLSFNVSAVPVSIGPIVEDLDTPATSVATALVIYSLFVAALVMVGAKVGRLLGERLVFQAGVIVHGIAMGMMALSTDTRSMNNAQAIAGAAAAAMVPTLVVLITTTYQGKRQVQALGVLAGTPAVAGALAFFIAGLLGSVLGWRYSFGLLAVLAIVVTFLSFRLTPVPRQPGVRVDVTGAVLAGAAIALISVGFNNLNSWGLLLARDGAPLSVLGLSPAPFMIAIGIVLGQAFFASTLRRVAEKKTPLLSPEVLDTPYERSALFALLVIGALGPAVTFLIALYVQIVQDRSTLFTAVAVVPYSLAIAAAAIFVVGLYNRLTPRQVGVASFALVATGLTALAFTIRNDWGTPVVVLGLILVGLGEGALLTLVFNVMIALSPRRLAGDVGALRGVANNLSTALGTAFASVVAVGLLGVFVTTALNRTAIPASLKSQVNLDSIHFVTNTHLQEVLSETTATPEQVGEAVGVNEEARLRALKASFVILGFVALLAIFPASQLPRRAPGATAGTAAPRDGQGRGAGRVVMG